MDLSNTEDTNFGDEEYTASIESSTTEVASTKGNKVVLIVVAVIAIIGLGYLLFSKKDSDVIETPVQEKKKDKDGEEKKVPIAKAPTESLEPIVENLDADIDENNAVVEVPDIEVPKLPPMENVKIDLPKTEAIIPEFKAPEIAIDNNNSKSANITPTKDSSPSKSQSSSSSAASDSAKMPDFSDSTDNGSSSGGNGKQQASMMLLNAGGATQNSSNEYVVASTTFAAVDATKVFNTDRTIIQGKIVEAVLETAINTDFAGSVRAIVSQDVFAESGRAILVPKGSRLIGSYTGSVAAGQTRVLVTWQRLIRPDDVDIAINSPSTDQFGRAGISGNVDNKYLELFNNSILLSLITIGTAVALEGATGNSEISVTKDGSNGDTTTSGSATDFAADEIINTIGDTANTILSGLLNVTPTITVPQGTRINVFVNQDLVFPPAKSADNSLMLE